MTAGRSRLETACVAVGAVLSVALLYASARKLVEIDLTEALGFVSGGACVWLAVKENIWNWPIGIANNVFYTIVFFQQRLFADMSLQVAFAALGFYGWVVWLRRTGSAPEIVVRSTPRPIWIWLGGVVALATVLLATYLARIDDAAPFLDALTTTLSLGAQYLLTRKYLENWYVWMTVDVVSVGLYAWKGLGLTALLYALFFSMCVVGARGWRAAFAARIASGRA
jgi:nicotinamide mononucleotide transporter